MLIDWLLTWVLMERPGGWTWRALERLGVELSESQSQEQLRDALRASGLGHLAEDISRQQFYDGVLSELTRRGIPVQEV